MVLETMNPSPSTDCQYINFNRVFQYKAGTYATGTRYLRAGTRYRVPRGRLLGTGIYIKYLIHQYLLYNWSNQGEGSRDKVQLFCYILSQYAGRSSAKITKFSSSLSRLARHAMV